MAELKDRKGYFFPFFFFNRPSIFELEPQVCRAVKVSP